jgi:uncharacterized membrane-anchored protein YitT (DUF2179 family)
MFKSIFGDDPRTMIKNVLLVVLGTVILAAGVSIFLIPFDLVAGGVTGLAIAIANVLSVDYISVELLITVFTWLFFFIGLIFVGRGFAMKTLVSTVVYPMAVYLFGFLVDPEMLGGYFYLPISDYPDVALILSAVVGGTLVGVGVALAFAAGSSTGGVDIIAYLICKRFPRLKISKVTFYIDATIVLLGVVAIGDLVVSLLGVISALVSSLLIDRVFLGGTQGFVAYINSSRYDEIRVAIIDEMDRTSMILDVTGGYSGHAQHVVMVSFTMRQYATLMSIIHKVDKTAFVTIHRAHEINGYGWTYDKMYIEKNDNA